MNWIKRYGGYFILIFISAVGAVFFLETILRLASFKKILPVQSFPQYYFRDDRQLGYDIAEKFPLSRHLFHEKPYSIWSNDLGCFDEPYDGKTPYIYLAGDSFAWGFAPFEDKWGRQLELITTKRVLKCGVPGFGVKQEFIKAKRLFEKLPPPQLVMLSYFINDAEDDYSFPNRLVYNGYLVKKEDKKLDYESMAKQLSEIDRLSKKYCMWTWPEHPEFQRIKCLFTKHSVLYNIFKNSVKNLFPTGFLRKLKIVNPPLPAAVLKEADWEEHYQNIVSFYKLARSYGAEFLMVLVPIREDVYDNTISDKRYASVKSFLQENNIPFLDLFSDFRAVAISSQKQLYWKHDSHWNANGNRLAALLIARHIAQYHPDIFLKADSIENIENLLQKEFFK